MPRVNPFSLKRAPRVAEARDFTDSGHPDLVVTFTLRKPDAADQIRGAALARQMIELYLTGSPDLAAQPFLVDGEPVELSPILIDQFCTIAIMQPPAEELGYDPYSPDDIGQFAFKCPDLWIDLQAFYREVLGRRDAPRDELPNSAAPTATPSGSP